MLFLSYLEQELSNLNNDCYFSKNNYKFLISTQENFALPPAFYYESSLESHFALEHTGNQWKNVPLSAKLKSDWNQVVAQ